MWQNEVKIGRAVEFLAVFENNPMTAVKSRGTISDIRDGVAFAFVLGYRWPFAMPLGEELALGFYPCTAPREEP